MLRLISLEWLQLWRSRVLPVCLVCGVLCAGMSVWMTIRTNRVQQISSERAAGNEYSRWLAQGPKYAHAAAHYGMYAMRPVYGTSNAEPGVMPYTGQSVYMEAHVQDPAVYRAGDDDATAAQLGDMAPAWVCRAVLPLLAVVLAASSMAADRARGTLRLTLLHSSSVVRLLTCRAAAAAFFPALIALLTMGTALLAAVVFHMQEPASTAARWLVMFAVAIWPSCLWALVAVAVAAWTSRAATAFAVAFTLWLVCTVLVPRFAVEAAQKMFPSPTRQELASQIRNATGESEDPHAEELLTQATLKQYGVQRVEDLSVSLDGIRREHAELKGDAVFDHFWGGLFAQYARQQHAQNWFALLSPALAGGQISAEMAGTGVSAQTHFQHDAEEHRRLMQRILNEELSRKRAAREGLRPVSTADVWRRVPQFRLFSAALYNKGDVFVWMVPLCACLLQTAVALFLTLHASRTIEGSRG